MENLLSGRFKNNFSDEALAPLVSSSDIEMVMPKHLSDYTNVLDRNFLRRGKENTVLNIGLPDKAAREIAKKLARAIDKNAVEEIKNLKTLYGSKKEFLTAKNFLNEKCKQVWDVSDKNLKPPIEALKTLGITNKPTLDFLLGNCVKYFEKDGGRTTVQAISSILSNRNLDYTIQDIHKYLAEMHLKEKCEYNHQTIKYLIVSQNYDNRKLEELGVEKSVLDDILRSLPLKQRINYFIKNFCALIK